MCQRGVLWKKNVNKTPRTGEKNNPEQKEFNGRQAKREKESRPNERPVTPKEKIDRGKHQGVWGWTEEAQEKDN